MKREAKVVRENGRLMAEVIRAEACQSCRACRFGQTERVLVELPAGGEYREGDEIELEVPDGTVSKGVLVAYALPLAFMLLGLFLGSRLGGEGVQALCAGAGLALGLGAVRPLSRRLKGVTPSPCAQNGRKRE